MAVVALAPLAAPLQAALGRHRAVARVGFFVHPERQDAACLAKELAEWLQGGGHAVVLPETMAGPHAPLDLVVSLGGDGTMLRAVAAASPGGVPVLGVNLGNLGFLTEVEPEGARHGIEQFLRGEFSIDERMTIAVTRHLALGGPATSLGTVLNEVVVERGPVGHTVRLGVVIGGSPFLTYAADAFIVATPTGSTAYNLSARGPVLLPHVHAMVLTPVSPHTLFDRSLVVGPADGIRLEILEGSRAEVRVDGVDAGALGSGDALVCTRAATPARLVRLGPAHFHEVIRSKFGLTDR